MTFPKHETNVSKVGGWFPLSTQANKIHNRHMKNWNKYWKRNDHHRMNDTRTGQPIRPHGTSIQCFPFELRIKNELGQTVKAGNFIIRTFAAIIVIARNDILPVSSLSNGVVAFDCAIRLHGKRHASLTGRMLFPFAVFRCSENDCVTRHND